jgi:hypothetical protein
VVCRKKGTDILPARLAAQDVAHDLKLFSREGLRVLVAAGAMFLEGAGAILARILGVGDLVQG